MNGNANAAYVKIRPGQRVEQTDSAQHEEQRHDRQEDRERQPGEHEVIQRPAARKGEPSEHVRRHRTEQHRQNQGAEDDDHRIEEEAADSRGRPGTDVVVEAPALREGERGCEDLRTGLERGHEDPDQRQDDQDGPDDQDRMREAGHRLVAGRTRRLTRFCWLERHSLSGRCGRTVP